jgi:hypothetical protein
VPFVANERLALDTLLARVRDVQRGRSRPRRANLEVARRMDSREVQRHFVTAARDLVRAARKRAFLLRQRRRTGRPEITGPS